MTISHRDQPAQPSAANPKKVARMACCCKLSDLLPLVRQQLLAKQQAQASERPSAEAA